MTQANVPHIHMCSGVNGQSRAEYRQLLDSTANSFPYVPHLEGKIFLFRYGQKGAIMCSDTLAMSFRSSRLLISRVRLGGFQAKQQGETIQCMRPLHNLENHRSPEIRDKFTARNETDLDAYVRGLSGEKGSHRPTNGRMASQGGHRTVEEPLVRTCSNRL